MSENLATKQLSRLDNLAHKSCRYYSTTIVHVKYHVTITHDTNTSSQAAICMRASIPASGLSTEADTLLASINS